MTAAQCKMMRAAQGGDIDGIIACGRVNPRLLLLPLAGHEKGTALYEASGNGRVKGS